MTRYFEFRSDTSHKFWEVTVNDRNVTIRYGKVGTQGQQRSKTLEDASAAQAYASQKIQEKVGKGYSERTAAPAQASDSSATNETVIWGDLLIEEGKTSDHQGSLFVNGWVTVKGQLSVTEDLVCLGMEVWTEARVVCQRLHTNYVAADAKARIECKQIAAQVVSHTQLALTPIRDDKPPNSDHIQADYLQHYGGELNPSWDNATGDLQSIPDELYEAIGGDSPLVLFDVARLQQWVRDGQSLIMNQQARVQPRQKPEVALPTSPLLEEFSNWLQAQTQSQREVLAQFEQHWLERLKESDADLRSEAARRLKREIRSPKLREQRDKLLGALNDPQ